MMNQLTGTHLDFYYRRVLLQQPKAAFPDQVPVHFELNPTQEKAFHPRGTILTSSARKAGSTIEKEETTSGKQTTTTSTTTKHYRTTKDLQVGKVKPVSFKTIYNGTVAGPSMDRRMQGALLSSPVANSGDGRGGAFVKSPPSWATLGAGSSLATISTDAPDLARLGWAIASPQLFLSDGQRIIHLSLVISEQAAGYLLNYYGTGLNGLAVLLERSFTVSFTSLKGWETAANLQVNILPPSLPIRSYKVHFVIEIEEDQPPMTAYRDKVHGAGYSTENPILQFVLHQKTIFYNPYPLLAELLIDQASIQVEVRNSKNFTAQNDISALKVNSPYALFGQKPLHNGNFYLGSEELFCKPLIQLGLEIEWYDLPQTPFGFCDYYRIYNWCYPEKPFYNSVFQWGADLLLDGKWVSLPVFPKDEDTDAGYSISHGMGLTSNNTPASTGMVISNEQQDKLLEITQLIRHKIDELRNALDRLAPRDSDTDQGLLPQSKNRMVVPMFDWTKLGHEAQPGSMTKSWHKDMHGILDHADTWLQKLSADPTNENYPVVRNTFMFNWPQIVGKFLWALLQKLFRRRPPLPSPASGGLGPGLPTPTGGSDQFLSTGTDTGEETGRSPIPFFPFYCLSKEEGTLRPTSFFEFDLSKIPWNTDQQIRSFSPKLKFNDHTNGGFLRFVLKNPSYAFGHAEYPRVVAKVANHNMKLIAHELNKNAFKGISEEKAIPPPSQHVHSNGILNLFREVGSLLSMFSPATALLSKEADKFLDGFKDARKVLARHENTALQSVETATGSIVDLRLPPELPYVPKIKSVQGFYTTEPDAEPEVFHLHPFGISVVTNTQKTWPMLPVYDQAGYLYIGLEKVAAPEKYSMLFVLDESSGNRNVPAPRISWSYLDQGQWQTFPPLSIEDGTNGLIKSGIISFELPAVISEGGNLLAEQKSPPAANLYWIQASADRNPEAVCRTLAVYPYAVVAENVVSSEQAADKQAISSESLAKVPTKPNAGKLPAGSISKLKTADPKTARIIQPIPSRGGIPPESNAEFYTRISERLRHKDRAITAWDFEHLALQQFSEIGLVRCLNHTSSKVPGGICPGSCLLLIMPEMANKDENALAPKTNQHLLGQVEHFFQSRIPPFIKLEVRNPEYEYVRVTAVVRLQANAEPGRVLNNLNEGLVKIIAPWAKNYQDLNPFENRINYFTLLEYLYRQESVKEVSHFYIERLSSDEEDAIVTEVLPESFDVILPRNTWGLLTTVIKHRLMLSTTEKFVLPVPMEPTISETGQVTGDLESGTGPDDPGPIFQTGDFWQGTGEEEEDTGILPAEIIPGNALYIRNDLYHNNNQAS